MPAPRPSLAWPFPAMRLRLWDYGRLLPRCHCRRGWASHADADRQSVSTEGGLLGLALLESFPRNDSAPVASLWWYDTKHIYRYRLKTWQPVSVGGDQVTGRTGRTGGRGQGILDSLLSSIPGTLSPLLEPASNPPKRCLRGIISQPPDQCSPPLSLVLAG
jgi:hypothetical protein